MPQFVDFIINSGIFFNIYVLTGNIRFRLVIIIVAYKILYAVVWEELLELTAQLGGKNFIMRQNQRGTVHPRNDIRHGKGFAGAGYTQQRLFVHTAV